MQAKSQFLPENGADGVRYEGTYGRGTLTEVDGVSSPLRPLLSKDPAPPPPPPSNKRALGQVKQIQWSQQMDGVRWTSLTEAGAAQLAKEESDKKQLEDKVRLAAGIPGDEKVGELIGALRDKFDELNTDKTDAVLDAAEIQRFFQSSPYNLTPEECKTALEKWDADKSGNIDFEEFCLMSAGLAKV